MNDIFRIPGPVRSKKNSRRLVMINRKPRSLPSKAHEKWHKIALPALKRQWNDPAITGPVWLSVVFYVTSDNFDLSNHIQSIEDLMQDAGIIADDKQVQSLDRSRKVVMCPHCSMRGTYTRGPKKGQRKPNCEAVRQCPSVGVKATLRPFIEDSELANPAT